MLIPLPIALLLGVLERVHRDGIHLLLVAPFWPASVWFSEGLSVAPFDPLEEVSDTFLTLKTVFLLAIMSLKTV